MKDYEKMWEELKKSLKNYKEYYRRGIMCSMSESTWGEEICNSILEKMKDIEEK